MEDTYKPRVHSHHKDAPTRTITFSHYAEANPSTCLPGSRRLGGSRAALSRSAAGHLPVAGRERREPFNVDRCERAMGGGPQRPRHIFRRSRELLH